MTKCFFLYLGGASSALEQANELLPPQSRFKISPAFNSLQLEEQEQEQGQDQEQEHLTEEVSVQQN